MGYSLARKNRKWNKKTSYVVREKWKQKTLKTLQFSYVWVYAEL